ncbi:hypothetical protein [Vallitalea okinawensis]|uniref:hypothetical protein n=1 Tax=Vallitalea okinawensis TaxID=2078660 RepID=UPI000CFADDCE|nr:hypothetical protein [Vallitalea okinawensis]
MSNKQKNSFWVIPLYIVIIFLFPRFPCNIQLILLFITLIYCLIVYIKDKKRSIPLYPGYILFSSSFTLGSIIIYVVAKDYFSITESVLMKYIVAPGGFVSLLALIKYAIVKYRKGDNEQKRIMKLAAIFLITGLLMWLIVAIKIISINL